jgi:uncharacterized protein (TIGR03437 family)
MKTPRQHHIAALLGDGRVLIAGGQNDSEVTAETEIFDPSTKSFSPSAPMALPRAAHAAVVLADGRILVSGGVTKRLSTALTDGVEVFDPASGKWTTLAPLPRRSAQHTATLLTDGRVLVTGGYDERQSGSSQVFAYDSSADVWGRMTPLIRPRAMHFALAVPDGRVLIGGAADGDASLEWYYPAGQGRSAAGPKLDLQGGPQAAVALGGDEVLMVGHASAIRFDWRTGAAAPAVSLAEQRLLPALATLEDSSVLVIGGLVGARVSGTVERWAPTAATGGRASTQARNISKDPLSFSELPRTGATATILLTPPSAEVAETGGSVTVVVTPVPSAPWTAQVQSGASWLSISGAASGTGNGSVFLQAAPNSGGTSRIEVVLVGGQPFTVRQRANAPAASVTLEKDRLTFGETAGSADVQILSDQTNGVAPGNGGVTWFSVSILPPSTNGGQKIFRLNVDANSTATSRAGNATYGDASVNVAQAPSRTGYQNVLAGVVRDGATGQPIAGARLFFYGSGYAFATTDSNGVYSLTGPDITSFGGALSGNLYVGAAGYFESSASVPDLSAQPSLPVVLDFALRPGGTIVRGVVRDAVSNAPVGGATLLFYRNPMCTFLGGGTQVSVTSAADGTYAIDSSYFNESGLTSGFSLNIQVNATGYLGANRPVNTFTAYPRTEDIVLTPTSGAVLRGMVTNRNTGQPIAGAQLFFYGSGYGYATADSNGVYSFRSQDISSFGGALSGNLYVGAAGYFESLADVPDLGSQHSLPVVRDFALRPGGAIVRGVVRDAVSNAPVGGATVLFSRTPMCTFRGGGTQVSVTSAADGTYAIDSSYFNESGVTSGFSLSIQVNATGYLGVNRAVNTFTAYPRTEDIVLTPTNGPVLRGRVSDLNTGQPIPGAQLFFYGSGYAFATADSNGVYSYRLQDISSFGGALSGTLYVGAVGYFESNASVPDLGAQPSLPVVRDFTLRPGGTIVRGVVRDAVSNAPVGGATVLFSRSPMCTFRGGGTQVSVTSAADGTYAIDSSYFNESGLTSGFSLSIQVNATGYLGATRPVNTFTAYPRTEDIALVSFIRLEPSSASLPGTTISGSFNVTLQGQYAGASWSAVSQSSWIDVTSTQRTATGGTVVYSVGANTTGSARDGEIRISVNTSAPNSSESVRATVGRGLRAVSPRAGGTLDASFPVTQSGDGLGPVDPGQALTCSTNVRVTPAARAEGQSEPTGDITLSCTGGNPLAANTAIPQVNIQVLLNTAVTSRLLPAGNANGISEALLLIDEPGSGLPSTVPNFGPQASQSLCPTPLVGCTEYAGNIGGSPVATDDVGGTTQGKNVFQGIASGNSVTFFGVPVLPPGATGGTRVFRITNIRADAAPLSTVDVPGAITEAISITPSTGLSISNPSSTVAFVSAGLIASASSATSLSQCSSQTRAAVSTLSFTENFGTAFKTRTMAQNNVPYAGQRPSPQNVPGASYNAESGFILDAGPGQTAGLADFGTRLKAQFNNIPPGVRLFVSATNVLNSSSPVTPPPVIGGSAANTATTPFAQLVSGESVPDGNVAGSFPAVAATVFAPGTTGSVPVAEIPILNGSGVAVWEVVNTNSSAFETIKFAVYATYGSNEDSNSPLPGTGTVNLSFASAGSASAIPRFISDPLAARTILAINSCAVPPTIVGPLSPESALVGSASTTITVNGTNFTNSSVVQWTAGGTTTASQTTFVSATRLTAIVTAGLLATAGGATVTVNQPGAGTSNGAAFAVLLPPLGISTFGQPAGLFQGESGFSYGMTLSNPTAAPVLAFLTLTFPAGLMPIASQASWSCGGNICTSWVTVWGGTWVPSPMFDVDINAPSSVTIQLTASASGFATATHSATFPVTPAYRGPLSCLTSVPVTPRLRAEGAAESVGDITLTCSGGTPLAANAQIPTTNLTVTLNTRIASRLLPTAASPSISEVLLLIDEPGSGLPFYENSSTQSNPYGPQAPQTVCPTPLQGCTEYAALVTPAAGHQVHVATNSPTPAGQVPVNGYNVFQGVISGNSVTFFGIPVLPPTAAGMTRVFRITNLRADATGISLSPDSLFGGPVTASVSATGAAPLLPNPTPTVGYVQARLAVTATSGNNLAQCSSGTKTSVGTLSFTESFGTAFKTRVNPTTNTPNTGQSPTPVDQNMPGAMYNSESTLVISGMAGGQTAGLADFGTRLKAQFRNIPAGVRLFVSVNNVTNSSAPVSPPAVIGGNAATGFAQLVPGETAPFSPVSATDTAPGGSGNVPVAEIPVINSSATAVWEVVNTDPSTIETLKFAVYATYSTSVAGGAATVNLSFAPTGSATTVPRFADTAQPLGLFTTTACAPAAPTLANPAPGSTGVSLAPTLTWNAASFATSYDATFGAATTPPLVRNTTATILATSYDVYFGAATTPPLVCNTTATSFTPGTLAGGVTYYWRVVARADGGTASSPTWSFTTLAPPADRITITVTNVASFLFERGGATPPAQMLTVQTDRVSSITLSVPAGSWLKASLTRSTTPAGLVLSVNPAGLANGYYGDVVTLSAPTADDVSVRVSLTIRDQPQLILSRTDLSFEFAIGGAAPATQSITVAATGRNLDVSAKSSAPWISVTPAVLKTPALLGVGVNPAGLPAGVYDESITLTSPDASNSPLKVPVKLVVTAAPTSRLAPSFEASGVVNAASFRSGPLAPGSLFTISGTNLAAASVNAATVPLLSSLGSTSVTINGVAAPLLYVSPTQINAQVPFEISMGGADVIVTAGGVPSAPVSVRIVPAAPGLFQTAVGRAAVLNQDSSLNTADNPSAAGSVIAAYSTGQGQVDHAPPTGSSATADPLSRALLEVGATIGGRTAEVLFSGLAPGYVGLLQVNLKVPNLPPGDYPVVFTIGGLASNSVLLSVR